VVKGPPALRRARLAAFALLTLAQLAGRAHAHPEPSPTLVNRYVTLAPAEARLGVQLTFLYGELPGSELRKQLDRDGDGKLSPRELSEHRQSLLTAQAALPLISLELDGRPVALEPTLSIDLGGQTSTGAYPLLIELIATVPLDPGEHRVRVVLGPDVPRMGETELMLDATNPWTLRGSLDGAGDPLPTEPLIRFPARRTNADEPRAGTFVIRSDGPLETRSSPGLLVPIIMVAAATAMGIALTLFVRKMERERTAGTPRPRPVTPDDKRES
jgi:hypothetical protein